MAADQLDLIIRVAVAGVLRAFLGLERELRGHVAGIRTHALVAIGAAMFSIAGAQRFTDLDAGRADPTRVAAQVAAGIGFVGAGAVLRSGASVRGLTTAATLWVSAAVGVAAAAAAYGPLLAGVVAALVVLPISSPRARRGGGRMEPKCGSSVSWRCDQRRTTWLSSALCSSGLSSTSGERSSRRSTQPLPEPGRLAHRRADWMAGVAPSRGVLQRPRSGAAVSWWRTPALRSP